MNESSPKIARYAVMGILILCLFIVLGWFAFHEERLPLDQQPVKSAPAKPQVRQAESIPDLADDSSSETPTNQSSVSPATNAAPIYRQAFDLFKALTNDERIIVGDWHTNVDASVEAEICEKLRPICELMHQASAVTNCDWGIDPITFETKLPHLNAARSIARAAIWSAAHCRSNNVAGVLDDTLSALRVGQQVSRSGLIGCLVDMAVQRIASSYVAENLGLFRGADSQRLAAALEDPTYEEAPSRAIEQEADMVERFAARMASLSPDELPKELSQVRDETTEAPVNLDRATALAALKQIVDSERELAKALASSSDNEYEAWLQHSTELQASNPLAKDFLPGDAGFVEWARRTETQRTMVLAGLAVAEKGPEALSAHLDPASGKPFQYTETDDGFELQSTLIVNEKPFKIRFK